MPLQLPTLGYHDHNLSSVDAPLDRELQRAALQPRTSDTAWPEPGGSLGGHLASRRSSCLQHVGGNQIACHLGVAPGFRPVLLRARGALEWEATKLSPELAQRRLSL